MSNQNYSFEIHFLVFSGRPNPIIPVDEELAEQIVKKLKSSQASIFEGKFPYPKLGYQGFLIINTNQQTDLPANFTVYNGIISSENGNNTDTWNDVDGLEKLLLDFVNDNGYSQLIKVLEIEW